MSKSLTPFLDRMLITCKSVSLPCVACEEIVAVQAVIRAAQRSVANLKNADGSWVQAEATPPDKALDRALSRLSRSSGRKG